MKILFSMVTITLLLALLTFPKMSYSETSNEDPNTGGAMKSVTVYNAFEDTYETVPVIEKSNDEWKDTLSCDIYHITREKGTEKPFSGIYIDNKNPGIYKCANCGTDLYSSQQKYDSGTGWPSFWAPVDKMNVKTNNDTRHFMNRTALTCSRCGASLGHVFNDGPSPTHERHCINSTALSFIEKE